MISSVEPILENRFFQLGIAYSVNNGVGENACTANTPYLDEASTAFFALFEGHRKGWEVSRTSAACLPGLLRESILSNGPIPDMRQCFENAFAKMDDNMRTTARDRGTTATACMVRNCQNKLRLHVSNVGNTRALLCRGRDSILRLTEDHTLTSEAEKIRLATSNSYTNSHERVRELLSCTRALGNHLLKGWVISTPHYFECDLAPDDSFLLLLTSNISAVLSDHEAVKLTHGATAVAAADAILAEARRRGAAGDLTVLAIRLDWDAVADRCERPHSSTGGASLAGSVSSSDSDWSGGSLGRSWGPNRAAFRWGCWRGAALELRPPLPSSDAAVG